MTSPTQKATADAADPTFLPPPAGEFLGHPRALWNLFGTEFWERFMYYGMRAMLAVHIARAFFGHLGGAEARVEASLTYGGFTSLVGCVVIFVGVLVTMSLIRMLINRMVKALGLSVSDRILGMIFGNCKKL